jgi:nucleotide-binding universal stress UspA family protein
MKFNKILFPIDFSKHSQRSLEKASEFFSEERSGEIIFLYVLSSPSDFSTWEGDPKKAIAKELEEIEMRFKEKERFTISTVVLTGHASTEICRYAVRENCDLIVIATHGRTGLKHMVLGSTAEQVVRHAPCPVLTLRITEF